MITDLEYLKTMAGDDPVFIREMIGIFKEQIDEYTKKMPMLFERGDYLALSKMAHKAKSSVAVMGMAREADLLKDLEISAKEGVNKERYKPMIEEFITQATSAVEELESAYK